MDWLIRKFSNRILDNRLYQWIGTAVPSYLH